MTTNATYVGSKITLISKSEIRYDGILFAVDTKEATVTLSKVRSYGTEDRHVSKPIPARDDVFEYIIFRGSDIKDLTIHEVANEDPSPHQDPAIVSTLQHPPELVHQPPQVSSLLGMPGPMPTGRPPPGHQMMHRPPGQDFMAYPPPPGFGSPFRPFYHPTLVMKAGPVPYTQTPLSQGMLKAASTHPASLTSPNSSTPITKAAHISLISTSPISLPESGPSTKTTSHGVATQTTSVSTQPSESPAIVPAGSSTQSQASEPTTATRSQATMQSSPHQPGPQKGKTNIASQTVKSSLQGHWSAAPVRTSPPTVTFVTNESTQAKSTPKAKEAKLMATPTESPTQGSPPSPQLIPRGFSGGKNRPQRQQRGSGRRGRGGWERNRDVDFQDHNQFQPRGWRGGYHDDQNRYSNQRRWGRSRDRDPKEDGESNTKQTFRYDSDFDFETANARFDRQQLEKEMKKMSTDDDDERIGPGADVGERQSPDVILVEDEEGDEQHQVDGTGNKASLLYKKDDFFDSISCESTQTSGNRRANRGIERSLNTETFGTNTRGYHAQGKYSYNRGGRYGRGRGGYQNYRSYDQRRGDYRSYQKSNFSGGGKVGGRGRVYGSYNNNRQSSEWKRPEQERSVQQEGAEKRQEPPEQQPLPPKPDATTAAPPEQTVTQN